MHRCIKLLIPVLLAFAPVAASAATIVGGDTRVGFDSLVAGLNPGLTGSATLASGFAPLTVNFPITGGDLDSSLAGRIFHDGSGVTLSDGTNILGLGNFIIDTTVSTLFGDASLNGVSLGTALPLFTFDLTTVTISELTDLTRPALELLITPTAAGALTAAFGVGDLSGVRVGEAATAPALAVVPEPATWAMLITGFALVGAGLRRRRMHAVLS